MLATVGGDIAVLAVIAAVAVGFGLIGLRWRAMRSFLVALAPLYSLAVFIYFQFEGAGSQCAGAGATFHCWEIPYSSRWGVYGWVVVGIVMIVCLGPIASARLRTRTPSVVAAAALALAIGAYVIGLLAWVPVWAAVLAAAIAGPPSHERNPKEVEATPAR